MRLGCRRLKFKRLENIRYGITLIKRNEYILSAFEIDHEIEKRLEKVLILSLMVLFELYRWLMRLNTGLFIEDESLSN
jgi:hypothetical protein